MQGIGHGARGMGHWEEAGELLAGSRGEDFLPCPLHPAPLPHPPHLPTPHLRASVKMVSL